VDINRAGETIRENTKISAEESLGYYEFKKHRQWFVKDSKNLLDQRGKKRKFNLLHDPSEINGDKLKNKRRESSRNFRISVISERQY
jgi:hypothetical protein